MFNKLRTRLILLILGGTILSIALVSVITNINIRKKFDLYMRNEQGDRLGSVIELAEKSYSINQGWTREAFNNILISSLIDDFDIEIKDNYDNIIFKSYMEGTVAKGHHEMMKRMGHGMMGRMGHGMMQRRNFTDIENNIGDENYIVQKEELLYDNEKVGSITIGHIGPFQISERDVIFAEGINSAIFYAAIISIIATIFLGMYSSKIFLKPILQITEAANYIREGKLDTKVKIDNNIMELQELSQSINHLSESLKEQELLRSRLTSDISHELRTPLTILKSHIEAISDGIWEATPEKLSICQNEVIRLIKLVEELKYLTDIENHKLILKTQEYSISEDLEEVMENFQHQFKDKGIQLSKNIESGIFIQGDRNRIKQVLINFLSNALKFTNTGGKVHVELLEDNENIKIAIKDTGMGIDDKDLPYIFQRLYRSDISRNRKTGGTGIGLSITKTVVEAHGGKITVDSKKNRGTVFTIILPKRSIY